MLTDLATDYIREVGEDVRARLFPRPKRVRDIITGQDVDGPTPVPLPVAIRYRPADKVDFELLFVVEKAIQWVTDEEGAPDVSPSSVRVYSEDDTMVVDLAFGKEPLPYHGENDWIVALLRAITGVL
jgi:hypothetical protein